MPYVRTHGNQVAIVHGDRDKTTGKVQQRALFTFYSRNEALAALGVSNPKDERYFQILLTEANPQLTFDWPELKKEIRSRLEILPEIYPVQRARTEEGLEATIQELTRQVVVADPELKVGREALTKYMDDLSTLSKIINLRLSEVRNFSAGMRAPYITEDGFCWKYEIQRNMVPDDIEEFAIKMYDEQNYEEGKPFLSLLTRCFPNWAEGYNYLGLIALNENEPKEAVEHFRNTVKYGRGLFPKRISKKEYWSDLSTRPYMRGLMNLALAHNMAGQFKDALVICDQLEKECGSARDGSAYSHRAAAHLNLHHFDKALEAALAIAEIAPDEGFIAGFALFELGKHMEAIQWFLHSAINSPLTANMLIGKSNSKPKTYGEVEDHNSGIFLVRSLPRYFRLQSKQSVKFLKTLLEHKTVKSLVNEAIECERNHYNRVPDSGHKDNFKRWTELKSLSFARKTGRGIARELGEVSFSNLSFSEVSSDELTTDRETRAKNLNFEE